MRRANHLRHAVPPPGRVSLISINSDGNDEPELRLHMQDGRWWRVAADPLLGHGWKWSTLHSIPRARLELVDMGRQAELAARYAHGAKMWLSELVDV